MSSLRVYATGFPDRTDGSGLTLLAGVGGGDPAFRRVGRLFGGDVDVSVVYTWWIGWLLAHHPSEKARWR